MICLVEDFDSNIMDLVNGWREVPEGSTLLHLSHNSH